MEKKCDGCGQASNNLRPIETLDKMLDWDQRKTFKMVCDKCWKTLFDGVYDTEKEDIKDYFYGVDKKYNEDLLFLLRAYKLEFKLRFIQDRLC